MVEFKPSCLPLLISNVTICCTSTKVEYYCIRYYTTQLSLHFRSSNLPQSPCLSSNPDIRYFHRTLSVHGRTYLVKKQARVLDGGGEISEGWRGRGGGGGELKLR